MTDTEERLTALLLPVCEDCADVMRTDPEKQCAALVADVLAVMRRDAARVEIERRVALFTAVIDATLDVCRRMAAATAPETGAE